MKIIDKAPVLVLGGGVNSLSLMRSFGREGIVVRACMAPHPASQSRYCKKYYTIENGNPEKSFSDLLLGGNYPEFKGSVIFSCGDDAVAFVARNHKALAENFLLERNTPELQLTLLDKQLTLELAREVGVPTPAFCTVDRYEDLEMTLDKFVYPAMLKPRNTHAFRTLYGAKYLLAQSADELLIKGKELIGRGIEFMVCEMIQGPDDRSCSYYTYRNADKKELLYLTKKCVRRHPLNEGAGTYQITEEISDVEAMGRKFFTAIGYCGIGNLEFKRDYRDNQIKVIECNNRFTAVQEQLVQSGVDAAITAYCDITDQAVPQFEKCEPKVAIWSPLSDIRAFRQLRADKKLSIRGWLRSMPHKRLVFPIFSWLDPMPFVIACGKELKSIIKRRLKKLGLLRQPKQIEAG